MSNEPALNTEARLYRDEHGLEYPVTHWFDGNGADCDPDEAVTAVAGCEGRWFSLTLKDFR